MNAMQDLKSLALDHASRMMESDAKEKEKEKLKRERERQKARQRSNNKAKAKAQREENDMKKQQQRSTERKKKKRPKISLGGFGISNLPAMPVIEGPGGKPLGALIMRVVEYLKDVERPVPLAELEEKTGVDITNNIRLLSELPKNPKVEILPDNIYQFKSTHGVKTREDIAKKVIEFPFGLRARDLLDSYKGIEEDIKLAVDLKEVVGINKQALKTDLLLFPRRPEFGMGFDEDIQQLWLDIKVPNEHDIQKELQAHDIKSMRTDIMHQSLKPKDSQKKRKNRRAVRTNTHMEAPKFDGPVTLAGAKTKD